MHLSEDAECFLKEWVGLDCSPNLPSVWRILPKRFFVYKNGGVMPHHSQS